MEEKNTFLSSSMLLKKLCKSEDRLADVMTKTLPKSRFETLWRKLGILSKSAKEEIVKQELSGLGKSQKALLADLASLISSYYQVLLVPSLRIPVHFKSSLIVEFIHIYGSWTEKDLSRLDWKAIEKIFKDEADYGGLLLGDQSLEFTRMIGIPEEDFGRVFPVYVLDLDSSTLLLLDWEIERPVVGSILQSMWGVSPTHLSWSLRHDNTLVDYTWSVGQTPFGPFSETLRDFA
ncbi:hypothetical protein GH714_042449 [Hevea brasiliensis]|uniref:Uncharacterized protein n=1 Tax=Hevea brasiliensis TaxID=3981 RepID=A0A6A6M5L0_HEVBR|nr:hypothetical protein GH714_042449 [Hevea brasiliensis]